MLRDFTDADGTQWRVWDVNPAVYARDSSEQLKRRLSIPPGWLCFSSGTERRRLAPIPHGWEVMDATGLCGLCDLAKIVQREDPSLDEDPPQAPLST